MQHGEVVEVLETEGEKLKMNGVWGFQLVKGGWMALHGGNWKLVPLPVSEPPTPEPQTRDEIKAEIIRLVHKL